MGKLSEEADIPSGWTGFLLFALPFEVEDYLVDEDGRATCNREDINYGQVFWLKQRGMLFNYDEADIEVEIDKT